MKYLIICMFLLALQSMVESSEVERAVPEPKMKGWETSDLSGHWKLVTYKIEVNGKDLDKYYSKERVQDIVEKLDIEFKPAPSGYLLNGIKQSILDVTIWNAKQYDAKRYNRIQRHENTWISVGETQTDTFFEAVEKVFMNLLFSPDSVTFLPNGQIELVKQKNTITITVREPEQSTEEKLALIYDLVDIKNFRQQSKMQ